MKICAKNDSFTLSFPVTLTVWPLDIELLLWRLLLFTFVQRYVFPKLQASAAFPFRENQRHGMDGQTDGVQRLMLPIERAAVINSSMHINTVVLHSILMLSACDCWHVDQSRRCRLLLYIHCEILFNSSTARGHVCFRLCFPLLFSVRKIYSKSYGQTIMIIFILETAVPRTAIGWVRFCCHVCECFGEKKTFYHLIYMSFNRQNVFRLFSDYYNAYYYFLPSGTKPHAYH